MNPKDFPSGFEMTRADPPELNPAYVKHSARMAAREELWQKYFDDFGEPSPIRGLLVCEECGSLVSAGWTHIDWHEGIA